MQIAPPDFDRLFGALADATRRDIARRAIDGEEGVAELASHYPMSFAAVQKHVAILERAGSRVEYHMTGPQGDRSKGYWEVDEVEDAHRLVLRDGFANDDGTPNPDLPVMTMRVTIVAVGGGRYRSADDGSIRSRRLSDLLPGGADDRLRREYDLRRRP